MFENLTKMSHLSSTILRTNKCAQLVRAIMARKLVRVVSARKLARVDYCAEISACLLVRVY